MPFKSEKQRKFLHANEPAVAKRWEQKEKSGDFSAQREKARQMRKGSKSKTGSGTIGGGAAG